MKKKDIKKITKDQILKNIDQYKKDLFNLRFQKINGQLTDPAKINEIKKTIARLKTSFKSKQNMPKKILTGKVISNKMNKTITVLVERKYQHPLFKKIIKTKKKYHAHDENNNHKIGDIVKIEESKPISKLKKFKVIEAIK